MRALSLPAAFVAASLLSAGSFVISAVPGAAERDVRDDRLKGGIFCPLNLDGEVAAPVACSRTWIADGKIRAHPADAPIDAPPEAEFELIELTRGAILGQRPADQSNGSRSGYEFVLFLIREDAFALLPFTPLTEYDLELAEEYGVELAQHRPLSDFEIRGGAPEAVTAWLREVVSLRFDRALREPDLFKTLMEDSQFVVRVADSDSPNQRAAEAETTAALEMLRTAIRFAITLE